MPLHLRPAGPTAADALLPGDPGIALLLAQELLDRPRMSNHARGLWGYHGIAATGRPLTIQSTGIGGPSAAIVLEELAGLGTRRAVRIGTCSSLDGGPGTGSLLVVGSALAVDGLGRELATGGAPAADVAEAAADRDLAAAVWAAAGDAAVRATVASSDRFYGAHGDRRRRWAGAGAVAVDMESATLFALGPGLGVAVAGILATAAGPEGERSADDELEALAKRAGRIAAAGLAGERAG